MKKGTIETYIDKSGRKFIVNYGTETVSIFRNKFDQKSVERNRINDFICDKIKRDGWKKAN